MTILACLFAVGGVGFAVAAFLLLRSVYGLAKIMAEVVDELKSPEEDSVSVPCSKLQCFHRDTNGQLINATGSRVAMSYIANTMSALDYKTALKLGKAKGAGVRARKVIG